MILVKMELFPADIVLTGVWEILEKLNVRVVAKKAGVGVGTVSRVINNEPGVRASTRERVLSVIKELGYVPNVHAQAIAGGKTRNILLITPEIKTEFYWRVFAGLSDLLDLKDYDALIYPLSHVKQLGKLKGPSSLIQQVDAVVLCTLPLEKVFKSKENVKVPLILLEGNSPRYDSIYVDNYAGGKIAAETLIGKGSENFFVIHSSETNPLMEINETVQRRLQGFKDFLESSGISLPEDNVIYGDLFLGVSTEKIVRILTKNLKPAIFALTDNLAQIVLGVAYALGLVPGTDFFLVGYDNQFWTERVGLTTIQQPMEKMGACTAEVLLKRLSDSGAPVQHVKFMPSLVQRNTA